MPSIIRAPSTDISLTISKGRFMVPEDLVNQVQLPMLIRYKTNISHTPAEESFRVYVMKAGADLVQANMKRGWHFRGDLGVRVKESELQIDFYDFGGVYETAAKNQGQLLDHNEIALTIQMWFEAPMINVVIQEEHDKFKEPEGFTAFVPKTEDGIVEV